MKARIGIGVVGAGSIGVRGALQHLCLPDVRDRVSLAAVCDPAPGRAETAAAKFGVAHAYEKLEDLLADSGVDAITIGSPIGLHYEQGLMAIRAGKHVHFNKTMTTTADEALHLIAEANDRGVKLVASPGQMNQTHNRQIRKMIARGDLGKLTWASTGASFGTYHENEDSRSGDDPLSNVNPAWYWRKPGGGPLYDMTVYGLHALTGILGPAKRVTAMSGIAIPERTFRGESYKVDADDNTLMLLDFGDTLFAFAYGAAAGSNTAFGQPTFFGTKGTIEGTTFNGAPIKYPGWDDGRLPYQRGRHITEAHLPLGETHVFEDIMQLVDYVLDGTTPYGTAEHACHVIEIIDAGYRASATGQTQELKTSFIPIDSDKEI
jgi:predicted dehydrogenase